VLSDGPPTGIHSPHSLTNPHSNSNSNSNSSQQPSVTHNPKYAHVASKLLSPTVATICGRKDRYHLTSPLSPIPSLYNSLLFPPLPSFTICGRKDRYHHHPLLFPHLLSALSFNF
jgi:hypothetical protein